MQSASWFCGEPEGPKVWYVHLASLGKIRDIGFDWFVSVVNENAAIAIPNPKNCPLKNQSIKKI